MFGLNLSVSERVWNGIVRHIVCNTNIPSEEKHAKTVNVSLVVRRCVDAVDGRLEEVSSQSLQRIADVDSDGLVLRLDPLPLLLRVQDLQSGNGLAEEKCDASKISVTWRVKLADLRVELRRASSVVHVSEMIFSLDVVLVVFDQLIFIGEFEDDGKEAKELVYHF